VINIKFSISIPTYNSAHKRYVMGDTPVYTDLVGAFAEIQTTLESEIVRGSDGDRPIRYRLLFQRLPALDDIRVGSIIEVTHKRHPVTNSWVKQSVIAQYIIQSETDVQFIGNEINLGLVRKDQQ
jgi:hypothetical protein